MKRSTISIVAALFFENNFKTKNMALKKITIQATYNYEIEIDEDNEIVKEYESEKELLNDLTSYRFMILPVIDNGVNIG